MQSPNSTTAALKNALLIGGRIKSGKSSISRSLAERLCASYSSFGDEVRRRARLDGSDPDDRELLQELGEKLVRTDPASFVDSVLSAAEPAISLDRAVVLDGLRHVQVAHIVTTRLPTHLVQVIYIDTPDAVRHARAMGGGVSSTESARADRHPNESETQQLKTAADIVVGAAVPAAAVVDEIILWLSSAGTPR